MRKFLHDNSLTIVAFGLFILFWAGMSVSGFYSYNEEAQDHGREPITFLAYLLTGHFWEATFENWESEYLQMGLFVILTAFLIQKGAAESKTEEEHQKQAHEGQKEETEENPSLPRNTLLLKLYENSLGIVLLGIFILSFILHAVSGTREHNREQSFLGKPPIGVWSFMMTSDFWFQSLQNWQSEFLAIASLIVLSIYLRQKGSSESKQVGDPNAKTGTD